jgi:hypothetical protein
MQRRRLVTLLVIAIVGLVHAADVTGTWTAQTPSRTGGTDTTIFELRADGKRLTGRVRTAGRDYPIQDGTIDGDALRFHITVNIGRDVRFLHTGTVAGDEIRFTRELEGLGRRSTFVARRAS